MAAGRFLGFKEFTVAAENQKPKGNTRALDLEHPYKFFFIFFNVVLVGPTANLVHNFFVNGRAQAQ